MVVVAHPRRRRFVEVVRSEMVTRHVCGVVKMVVEGGSDLRLAL
jgi:hypothetical protein